jgi:hypothetical protein
MKQILEGIDQRLEETSEKFTIQTLIEKIMQVEHFTVSFDGGKTERVFKVSKNWNGINPDVDLFIDLHFQLQNLAGAQKVVYKQSRKGVFYSIKTI